MHTFYTLQVSPKVWWVEVVTWHREERPGQRVDRDVQKYFYSRGARRCSSRERGVGRRSE
jgi:hypothetical protein